jgi:FkbM family methyltransferase
MISGKPRAALKRAAARMGVLEPARRVRFALADDRERRKRRDHDVLPALLASVLRPGDRCVDAGANQGDVLDLLVRLAPQGPHVAFEPVPVLAQRLRERFSGSVDVREAALADAPGHITFQYFPDHPDYSGIEPLVAPSAPEAIEVRATTLDEELSTGPPVQLIKMDVEGAELAALRGAATTLREQHPVVVFEHTLAAARNGVSSRELADLLVGAGYRVFAFDGTGPLSPVDFERLVRDGGYENFIARV